MPKKRRVCAPAPGAAGTPANVFGAVEDSLSRPVAARAAKGRAETGKGKEPAGKQDGRDNFSDAAKGRKHFRNKMR